jgi:hypothetical protein
VDRFAAASPDVRGCVIFGAEGVLAATGSPQRWADAGPALLDSADAAAGKPATHAHVATEEGEVFVVRSGDLAMVTVAARFTLASLMFADMRAALRLARQHAAPAPATAEAA